MQNHLFMWWSWVSDLTAEVASDERLMRSVPLIIGLVILWLLRKQLRG